MSLINDFRQMENEAFQQETGLKDWQYHDLPRMSQEYLDKFIKIIGKENIKWITFADYGETKRGQIMISPAGVINGQKYAESLKQ